MKRHWQRKYLHLYCVILAIGYAIHFAITSNAALPTGFEMNHWDSGIVIVTNVVTKAYVAHYPLPPMFEQLKNRSVPRMKFVILVHGLLSVLFMYLLRLLDIIYLE